MLRLFLITTALFLSTNSNAHEFTWDNLMLADAQLYDGFDYEVMVDSYMQMYRKPVWNKYKNDEFELETKRLETIEMMKNRIESFDLDEEFNIRTSIEFEKYDFKEKMFPLKKITYSTFFKKGGRRYAANNQFPSTYFVFFGNTNILGDLPMEKAEAQLFIQNKKSSAGYINRKLPMEIKFKVREIRSDDNLNAEITEIVIYDKDNTKVLATFI